MKEKIEILFEFILILMLIFLISVYLINIIKCPNTSMDINGCYTEIRNYN